MLIRRISILSIAILSISLACGSALYYSKSTASTPWIDPVITSSLR